MALAAGTKLGPYEIVALLGAGGMGEVYRGRDTRLGRDVAVKILPGSFARDADRLRRFEQEARAVAALNHPNILGEASKGARLCTLGENGTGFLPFPPVLGSAEGERRQAKATWKGSPGSYCAPYCAPLTR